MSFSPLGELTAFSKSLSCIQGPFRGWGKREKEEGRGKEKEEKGQKGQWETPPEIDLFLRPWLRADSRVFCRFKVTSLFFTRSCSSCRHFHARLLSRSLVFTAASWKKSVFARCWRRSNCFPRYMRPISERLSSGASHNKALYK